VELKFAFKICQKFIFHIFLRLWVSNDNIIEESLYLLGSVIMAHMRARELA
jgi:hypothetical protein